MGDQSKTTEGDGSKAERMAVGSAFSFGAVVVARVCSVVNSVVIIRTLGLFDLGIYSIMGLTISVAALVATFGVPQAMVKFLAEVPPDRPEDARRILGAGTVLTMTATSLTAAVLVVLAPLLASLYNEPQVSDLLLIAIIGLVLNVSLSPALATFQAFERIRELGIRNMVSAALSVPATVVLVLLLGLKGAIGATVVNSAVAILVNLPLLRALWRDRRLALVAPREVAPYRRILDYAVPAVLGSLLVTPVLWFTNTYLATGASFAEVGRYSVGYSLASYLLFVPSAIGVPLVPIVSRLDRTKPHDLPPFLIKTLRIGMFLLIPPTLLLAALPEPILAFLYGAEAISAAPLVTILAPAVFLAGVSGIVGFGIAGRGRMLEGLLLNLCWAIILLAGAVLLIPSGKAVGLSFAYLVAYVAHFAIVLVYLRYAWSTNLRPLALPALIAILSFSALATSILLIAEPAKSLVMAGIISGVVVAEFAGMSRRELEVLREPVRKLLLWIGPSP